MGKFGPFKSYEDLSTARSIGYSGLFSTMEDMAKVITESANFNGVNATVMVMTALNTYIKMLVNDKDIKINTPGTNASEQNNVLACIGELDVLSNGDLEYIKEVTGISPARVAELFLAARG